jgi:hypothetical protein
MQYPEWMKPALLGAGCGAVAITIIGFSQFGWKTSRSATEMAQERADVAVVDTLLPFCVAKAQVATEGAALAKVRAEDSQYSRGELVMQAGWATFGTSKTPDNALATACGDALHAAKSGA